MMVLPNNAERDVIPMQALILAGGASSRMGVDKAWMDYHGKPQIMWLFDVLKKQGLKVWISLQQADARLAGMHTVQDLARFQGHGPLSGLLSVVQQPGANTAWLVIGCDYPLFGEQEISHLIAARNPSALATVFRVDGCILPFPAIWEPEMLACLVTDFTAGRTSMRRSLEERADRLQVISPLSAESLQSADTPEAAAAIRLHIGRKAE